MFAALVTALGELSVMGLRLLRGVTVIPFTPHALWMTPLGYVVTYLALAGLLLAVGPVVRSALRPGPVAFIFAFVGGAAVLLVVSPPLHWAAALLLAAGIAWQLARLSERRTPVVYGIVRRATGWFVLAAVLVGASGALWPGFAERRARAALPAAPAAAPNVLLLILDTVRGENLSLHGYERPTTPRLDSLAGRSLVFDRAIAPSSWTLPSHASILTGRWTHELSANWRVPLNSEPRTLAEELASHGYATAGFVANLIYTFRGWGLARGFARYEDFPVTPGQIALSFSIGRLITDLRVLRELVDYHDTLNRKQAEALNGSLLKWIDRVEGRPFFAFVNYFDAHEPLLPPSPFDRKFGSKGIEGPFVYSAHKVHPEDRYGWSAERVQIEQDAYDGAIAYLDHAIGELLGELEQRGELERTIVVVTSDHGEQFGEHRLLAHGNSLYMQVLGVPLVILAEGRAPEGVRVPDVVSLRDLPATLLDLAGFHDGQLPGESLRRYWENSPGLAVDTVFAEVTGGYSLAGAAWAPIKKGDVHAAFAGRYHFIRNGDGSEELYDIVADPDEIVNLAGDSSSADIMAALRGALDAGVGGLSLRPPLPE